MATLHPADKRALRYHLDEQMIGWVQQLAEPLLKTPCFEAAASELDPRLLAMFVEQALHGELLGTRRGLVRRQYAASQGLLSCKTIDCPAHLLPLVQAHWPDQRFSLKASREKKLQELRKYLRDFVIERSWRWKYPTPPAHAGPAMVAVELVEGADPDSKCDAFWLANGAFDPARVLFVLERANLFFFDPAAQYAAIKKIGAQAIALHPSTSADGTIPVWHPSALPPWVAELKTRLPGPRDPLEKWLRSILLHCMNRVGYWEAFFRFYNVAVHQQFTEATFEIIAKRMAISRLRGIEIGKMRSEFFDLGSTAFYFHHQVAFVWHRRVRKYLETGRNRTECIVDTGYVYDHLFESLKNESAGIRSSLTKAGATLVLGVYDNMPHPISHSTQPQLIAFYESIIRTVEADASIGLLVKSKKPHILKALPQIKERLAVLEASGRCHIITELGKPVAVAAMACDIAVGFPVSTALCETIVAGRPGIMYDPGGAPAHPFANSAHKVVFNTLPEFEVALSRLLEQYGNRPSTPPRDLRLLIDKYLDGNSHVRAAGFINDYLCAFETGLAPDAGIRRAALRMPYCEMLEGKPVK
jgi:hypothetical protein